MWIDRYHNYVHNLTLCKISLTYAVSNHAPSFPFIIVFSPRRAQEKNDCIYSQLRNLMPFQFMRCCSISKMYLHNEAQFCAKTNVTSTAHQFQFSFAFRCIFVATYGRILREFLRAHVKHSTFACSQSKAIAITFDRIIFIRDFRRNRRQLQSLRRPLIRLRLNRNSLDFRWTCCRPILNLRLPAASFYSSFYDFGTRLSPAKDRKGRIINILVAKGLKLSKNVNLK